MKPSRFLERARSAWNKMKYDVTEARLEIIISTTYSETVERMLLKQRFERLLRRVDELKGDTWKIVHSVDESEELKLCISVVAPVADRCKLWIIHKQASDAVKEVFPAATMSGDCFNMGEEPQQIQMYGG